MEETNNLKNDIGKLVEILLRQWQLVAILMLLFALIAGAYLGLSRKIYRASALVASVKSVSSVSFGSKIETLSEDQLSANYVDRKARFQSYVNLIDNVVIAEKVWDEIGPQFPGLTLEPLDLLEMIQGGVVAGSDSIEIAAISNDPALSSAVANSWARHYVEQVNMLYGEHSDEAGYAALQAQLEKIELEYDAAQSALEDFIAQSGMSGLNRRIKEQQDIISGLSSMRGSVLVQVVDDLQARLFLAYQNRRRVEAYLTSASDMRDQVQKGGDSAANSNLLALNILKTQVYVVNQDIPEYSADAQVALPSSSAPQNFIIQSGSMTITAQAMLGDLDGLITSLQDRQVQLDDEIVTLSGKILNARSEMGTDDRGRVLRSTSEQGMSILDLDVAQTASEQKIDALENELNTLQSQLEQQKTRLQRLQTTRDLAWDAYKTLALKLTELDISQSTKNATLALAVPASMPQQRMRSVPRYMLISVIIGFLLGIILIYAVEFWWSYKNIEPYPIVNFQFGRRKPAD